MRSYGAVRMIDAVLLPILARASYFGAPYPKVGRASVEVQIQSDRRCPDADRNDIFGVILDRFRGHFMIGPLVLQASHFHHSIIPERESAVFAGFKSISLSGASIRRVE